MIYSWLWDGDRDYARYQRVRRLAEHPNLRNRDRETQLAIKGESKILAQRHFNWLMERQRRESTSY